MYYYIRERTPKLTPKMHRQSQGKLRRTPLNDLTDISCYLNFTSLLPRHMHLKHNNAVNGIALKPEMNKSGSDGDKYVQRSTQLKLSFSPTMAICTERAINIKDGSVVNSPFTKLLPT